MGCFPFLPFVLSGDHPYALFPYHISLMTFTAILMETWKPSHFGHTPTILEDVLRAMVIDYGKPVW